MEVISRKESLFAISSFVVLALTGYLLQVFIGHAFGVEGLGEFNGLLAYFLVFSLIATLGSNFGVLAFIVPVNSQGSENQNIQYLRESIFLALLGSVIVVSVTWFLILGIGLRYLVNNELILCTSISIVFFAINKALLAYVNARGEMMQYYVIQSVRYLLMLVFAIVVTIGYKDIDNIWLVFVGAEVLLFIVLVLLMNNEVQFLKMMSGFSTKQLISGKSPFLSHSLKALPNGVMQELAVRVDVIMLTLMIGSQNVGYYSVAAMIAEGLNQILVVWRDSFTSRFSLLFKTSKQNLRSYIIGLMYRGIFGFTIVCISAILVYKFIIGYLFSLEIAELSFTIFSTLTLGLVLSSTFTLFQYLPNQIGKPRLMSVIICASIIVNICANYYLIPIYQGFGAALATMISYVVASGIFGSWLFVQLKNWRMDQINT